MQKLSGLDAAFWYLETPRTPMHVGGLYLFDGTGRARAFDFQALRAHLGGRLHAAPTLRQRLITPPLKLDHPYWAADTRFNLDAHLRHTRLSRPGDWPALIQVAERIFEQALDPARPLWEITFVEGLDAIPELAADSFALIIKVHHAAVDGVSGDAMVWALLDAAPESEPPPESPPWQPPALPGRTALWTNTLTQALRGPATALQVAGDLAQGVARTLWERVTQHTPLPPLPLSAPSVPFNGTVTARRAFRGWLLSLKRVKAIKNAVAGATVNDVVLAICAGGLRRYLDSTGELPSESLIAAVPISIRAPAQLREMGNRVSAMLVALATEEHAPLVRLRRICDNTAHAKVYSSLLPAERLAELLPATMTSTLAEWYCRLQVPQRLGPIFNLFITNVPGPRESLYLGGARLQSHLGMAPVYDGLGLIMVITSYCDKLVISVTTCPDCVPDLDAFMNYLNEALAELETAVKTEQPA